jgi:hypothetical protein
LNSRAAASPPPDNDRIWLIIAPDELEAVAVLAPTVLTVGLTEMPESA